MNCNYIIIWEIDFAQYLTSNKSSVKIGAASELGPKFKITTLVGCRIILGITLVPEYF